MGLSEIAPFSPDPTKFIKIVIFGDAKQDETISSCALLNTFAIKRIQNTIYSFLLVSQRRVKARYTTRISMDVN